MLGVKVGIAQLKDSSKTMEREAIHSYKQFYNKTPFYSIAEAFQNIDKKELDEKVVISKMEITPPHNLQISVKLAF
ncbi:hypothetical protein MKD52_08060 [Helicobacter sp. CaF467b]|uniref:hypothetical protein n=1 Tax=Helicobacter sp. CaF467b TaxID=2919923 RepID=UPI001F56B66A|nr:hypothetical protein [Helicobacter sp. CaF467b]MCI2236779.1 hypothetical protein [Helicobacter sp. CaF467b]